MCEGLLRIVVQPLRAEASLTLNDPLQSNDHAQS